MYPQQKGRFSMTKQQLSEALFTWAASQKVMVPNEKMRKKFAQRLKLQVLKLLKETGVVEQTEPIRGGCVTTIRKDKKPSKAPTVLTEVESMKGDRDNPNN